MWRFLLTGTFLLGCSQSLPSPHSGSADNDPSQRPSRDFVLPTRYENGARQLRIATRNVRHYIQQLEKSGDMSAASAAQKTLKEVLNFGNCGVRRVAQSRLHVVGIHEGDRHDDRAEVVVSDTSSPIVLCICAYNTIRWTIRVEEGVELKRVIVGGYEMQELESLPEGVPVVGRVHSGDSKYRFNGYRGVSSWSKVDSALRKITELPVASRIGQYRYEDVPLVVGPANAEWLTQMQMRSLRDLEIQAMAHRALNEERDVLQAPRTLLFRNGSCSVGSGTLRGPDQDSLQPINGGIHRLVDAGEFGLFTLHDYKVKQVDCETGELTVPEFPRLEEYHGDWPIAADTDRGRLYVWGHQLRSVDLETKEVVVHRQGNIGSIVSIAYCEQRKCLFGISSRYDGDGHSTTTITRMNLRGADIAHVHLESPICFRGRPQMWMENGRLVVNGQTQESRRTRSYVFDPDSGRLLFVSRFVPRVFTPRGSGPSS